MVFISWPSRTKSRGRSQVRRTRPQLRVELLESREVLSHLFGPGSHVLQVNPANPQAYHTIQSAVDAADPGDKIIIASGTYKEAVAVSTSNLSLAGAPGATVLIKNPGGAMNGITVEGANGATVSGFALANVTVADFACNGVYLSGVNNFTLSQVTASNNDEYGVFPVLSSHGQINGCTVSGSNDTGIYVGQSDQVMIRGSTAFNNVNGIEIENSTGVTAIENKVFGNTVGILEDLLPGFPLPYEVSSHNNISNNVVYNNNRANTAAAADIAAIEPPGTGIALIGGAHAQVQNNIVFGNGFAGIAVLSGNDLLTLAEAAGISIPSYPSGVDADPEHTEVHNNIVVANGFAMAPAGFPQPADLVWTGTGQGNHWHSNVFLTSTPGQLP